MLPYPAYPEVATKISVSSQHLGEKTTANIIIISIWNLVRKVFNLEIYYT